MLEISSTSGIWPPIRAALGRIRGFHCCKTTRRFVSPAAYRAEASARGEPGIKHVSTNMNGPSRVRRSNA